MLKRSLIILVCFGFLHAIPSDLHNRMKGAILGAALGDALGRVTEFIPTVDAIHEKYGSNGITSFADFQPDDWITHPTSKNTIAAYTDDTLLSVALLEELLKTTDTTKLLTNYADRLAAIYGPEKYTIDPLYDIRAHGPTCIGAAPHAKERIEAPSRPTAPELKKEGGCGSVMRAWPIGLLCYDNIELVQELADRQSCLTHRHPMARAASVAMAVGIATILQGPATPDEVVEAMIEAARPYEQYETAYKNIPGPDFGYPSVWFPYGYQIKHFCFSNFIAQDELSTSDMIAYAARCATWGHTPAEALGTHNDKGSNYRSSKGFLLGWAADEAVAAAVYIFLRHPHDLQAALQEAVNTPGDSDSIATLTGALVGAYSGWQGFQDIEKLEDYEKLVTLAERCAHKK